MLRATVYQVAIEPLENGAVAYTKKVLSLPAANALEFQHRATDVLGAPGVLVEFGPIGEPWRRL